MKDRFETMETTLEMVADKTLKLKIAMDKLPNMDKLQELENEIKSVKKVARQAVIIANGAEQYGGLRSIRIRGIDVKTEDNCIEKVVGFLHSAWGLWHISSHDIQAAHLLPRTKTRSSLAGTYPPTQVIVKFFRKSIRKEVMRCRKKLKGTTFSISEDLTGLNLQLINRLKTVKNFSSVWSRKGKIYVMMDGRKIRVNPFTTITELLSDAKQEEDSDN